MLGPFYGSSARPVKALADAANPEELFRGQCQNRPSVVDDDKRYPDGRWSEGCTNAWTLWEEIVPLGCKGSCQCVGSYLRRKRTSPRPMTVQPPSPRAVAGRILQRPTALSEAEQFQLKSVLARCPELDALTRYVRSFPVVLTERQGERLPGMVRRGPPGRPAQPRANCSTAATGQGSKPSGRWISRTGCLASVR
ncbi:hypothetical protein AMK19_26655 [Kitasatospora sp. CB01950]|nr:hypothetical protein AMK19_26655 [Kitasatospora sp. CB01950]